MIGVVYVVVLAMVTVQSCSVILAWQAHRVTV
jgi:hypothetical protein